jgi:protein gp37
MGDKSGIEWTDATWNCIYGCSRVSPGCEHCYAERMTRRLARGSALTILTSKGVRWSNKIDLAPERLDQPIRWQRPRMIFVNSLSDVWHKDVPNEYIAAMFGIMAATPRHTFQILTKRAARLPDWFGWLGNRPLTECYRAAMKYVPKVADLIDPSVTWPLKNVWIGVSVEDQKRAEDRLPYLEEIPAAVRFVSAEPLLGPLDFADALFGWADTIDWVIVGGESGPGSRPMERAWAESIRDQCLDGMVPFFMKQWGQYDENGQRAKSKKDTGCLIDGVDYKQYPRVA